MKYQSRYDCVKSRLREKMEVKLKETIAICVLTILVASPVLAIEAAVIYSSVCSPCHGKEREGKKPMGPSLKNSEFISTASDAEIKATIKEGRAGDKKKFRDYPAPMPAQKSLTDAELNALVKYLKTDIQKGQATRASSTADSETLRTEIAQQKEAVRKAEADLDYFVSRNDPSNALYSTFKGIYADKVKEEKKKLRALEKQLKEQTKP